jgi:acyl carrier protein
MSDSLEARVIEAVTAAIGADDGEVEADTTQDDVDGWDSAGIINLMMTLESVFGVKLHPDEAEDLRSVPLVIEVLKEKGVS